MAATANFNAKFLEHKEKGLLLFKASALERYSWLRHGFSTRIHGWSEFPRGTLNLGYTEFDSRDAVDANRKAFFEVLGAHGFVHVQMRQTHSDHVVEIHSPEQAIAPFPADAILTSRRRIILSVLTADCVPILLVDPRSRTLAAIHAGWRGTAQQIAAKTVATLQSSTHGSAVDFLAVIGPSIRSCCYEVGREVWSAFQEKNSGAGKYFTAVEMKNKVGESSKDKFLLNLVAANLDQLIEAGLAVSNISMSPDCTACHPDVYFSHRREGGKTGRMMAAIAMSEP